MQFFDSHCHLHDARIDTELSNILERAKQSAVACMVTCATMEKDFKRSAMLARQYADVVPCFGIHPWFIDRISPGWQDRLAGLLSDLPSGVGETGLDFMIKNPDRDRQIAVFEAQLAMAIEMERPINIHVRKAWDALIRTLKRFGPLKTPGLVHSYSGSADMVPVLEKYGLYISFSGSVTNPNSKKVLRALQAVSPDRFVLETDTPDIQPYVSGKRLTSLNEPANLPGIARVAADRLKTDFDTFCRQAYDNSLNLFDTILK